MIGVVSLMAVVTLRQDLAGAAGTDTAALVTTGKALVAVRDWTFLLGPGLMPALNALLLGALVFVPSILVCVTGFTRIIIVLSFVRRAVTSQDIPPNSVIMGLSLFLTLFVMGPTLDGGYYLLGLRAPAPRLFHDVRWGTGAVAAQTRARAAALGLRTQLLRPLRDVDTARDARALGLLTTIDPT